MLPAGLQAHFPVTVIADASTGIKGNAALELCQIHQHVVGTSAKALIHPCNGGEVPFPGKNINEFYGINHPVAE